MDAGQLVAVATAVGSLLVGLVSLLTVRSQQRKLRAEVDRMSAAGSKDEAVAVKVLGETAVLLLAPATKQIADLQNRLETADHNANELDAQLRVTTNRANELDAQLRLANARITTLESRVAVLTTRLESAQELLTQHGVPVPPLLEE